MSFIAIADSTFMTTIDFQLLLPTAVLACLAPSLHQRSSRGLALGFCYAHFGLSEINDLFIVLPQLEVEQLSNLAFMIWRLPVHTY